MALTKLSILFLYLRNFITPKFHLVTIPVICLVIFSFGSFFQTIFDCQPIASALNPTIVGTCIHVPKLITAGTITGLLTSVITLCFPVPIIGSLKFSGLDRVVVTGVLLIGGMVCIVALLRTTAQIGLVYTNPKVDLLLCTLWTFLKPELAIISACIATLRPSHSKTFYLSFLPKLSFISATPNPNPNSLSKKAKASQALKTRYDLSSEPSGHTNSTTTIVTQTAVARGYEYTLQGYPIKGHRETGEEKTVGSEVVKAWYEREEILDEGSGPETGTGETWVRKEVSIV
ncbi:hypothetical protein MMC17_005156 [Xylographa soralifera]|nr:hypothetical protein [Xylographa soralifera]